MATVYAEIGKTEYSGEDPETILQHREWLYECE